MEIEVTFTKKIKRCYHECPYFDTDGGPGSVMVCTHPDAGKLGDGLGYGIIHHPECDNGFPSKCPLLAQQKTD